MNGKHWLAFGIGLAVGYLVLPYAVNMLMAKKG